MASTSLGYDVFLCHSHADKSAVTEIDRKLVEQGLRPWLDGRDLAAGSRWQDELVNRIESVAAVAVFVGPGGIRNWHGMELGIAVDRAANGKCTLIPVILESCPASVEMPKLVAQFEAIDFRDTDSDPFARLVAAIRTARDRGSVSTPVQRRNPPRHNLPFDSLDDLFLGRDELLDRLARNLSSDPASVPVAKQVLCGLGGMGKTRLAIEYAWRYGSRYSAVFFISAETPLAIHRNLAGLASPRLMNLESAAPEDQVVERVLRWLHDNPGWLLILDDVDPGDSAQCVTNLLPQLYGGHVLLTSRVKFWPRELRTHQVDRLEDEVAAHYLLEHTDADRPHSADDTELATRLASELDGLPLALELAAAYISFHGLGMARYLSEWNTVEVLNWQDEQVYPKPFAKTWQQSFMHLGLTARALMRLTAHLAPAPIPAAMLEKATVVEEATRRLAQEEDAEPKLIPVRKALAELAKLSLVTWKGHEAVVVHRMVQAVVNSHIADEARRAWAEYAVKLVNDFTPGNPRNIRFWREWDRMRPHARSVIELARRHDVWQPTTELMNNLGVLLHSKALFSEAEHLFRDALRINEHSSREGAIAINLHNLARLLHDVNRLREVEPLFQRALEIDEKILGQQDSGTATDLFNMARFLHDLNRMEEAEKRFRWALEIDEGTNHPEKEEYIARDLNGLGRLLHDTNRRDDAEALLRRALEIDEKIFDPGNVARDHFDLARVLHAAFRVKEAEQHYRRALEINEAELGDRHPYVATTLNNFARLLHDTNRLEDAQQHYQRALQIDEDCYGCDHPHVARDLKDLARFFRDTNRREETEPLYRRSLKIYEESHGENHPHVATVLNNLSLSLQDTKSWEEAEAYCRRALRIDESALGADHPHVARDLYALSRLLRDTHRPEEARSRCDRALEIDERALGPRHPHVATVLRHLARLLQEAQRLDEAEELCRRALRIHEAVFVPEHPRIARDRYRLACVLRDRGRREDARHMAQSALQVAKRSLWENHSLTGSVERLMAELNSEDVSF